MNIHGLLDRCVERLCLKLGRQRGWRKWLDLVGGALVPDAVPQRWAMPDGMPQLPSIFLQSGAGGAASGARPAPTVPLPGPHNAECKALQYRGMHGTPCKFNGGSDSKCPSDTVSGYWWTYDVPGLGVVYFVDCCGGANHDEASSVRVWCSWSNEPNWCGGRGRNIYTCTLAIPHADLKIDSGGLANPFFHVDVSDDDTVRDLVASFGSDLATLTNAARIELIKSLLAGWLSDDDVSAIVKILKAVPAAADMKAVRTVILPLANDIWSSKQKTIVVTALKRI